LSEAARLAREHKDSIESAKSRIAAALAELAQTFSGTKKER
jgi:hypothetical protein